jgi:hypothetical protein
MATSRMWNWQNLFKMVTVIGFTCRRVLCRNPVRISGHSVQWGLAFSRRLLRRLPSFRKWRHVLCLWVTSHRWQYSVEWWDDARATNSEGSGRKGSWPDRDTIAAFAWRNWGKPMKISVSLADVLAEIRTECLSNLILQRSREALYYNPEGRGFDSRWGHWIFQLT